MDAFKAKLQIIGEQLAGLSISQKMLTASLVAIMVMTIAWWGHYAGTAEMEPVLDQSLSSADMGQIKAALDGRGIPAKVVGDRILVPTDRKFEAMAELAYNNKLPTNSYAAWDEMTKQMSLWDSSSKTDTIYNHMKERLLADMITAHFPGVAKADVLINNVMQRRIGESLVPGASVLITTKGQDANTKKLVNSAAATVASAVPGLLRSHVTVVVDGITRPTQDQSSSFGGGDLYDQTQELEQSKAETLRSILPPGSLVAVSMQLDMTSKDETQEKYSTADSIIKDTQIDTQTTESNQPQPSAAEPGVGSNTALSAAAAPPPGNATNTSEKQLIKTQVFPGKTVQHRETPAGTPTVVSAAIGIPRSYFAKIFKEQNPGAAKEPDEAAIKTVSTSEIINITKRVKNAIGMKSDEGISVDLFYDTDTPIAVASNGGGGSSGGFGSMFSRHIRDLALGALAIVSLFMVSMIVKKGAPVMPVVVPTIAKETQRLDAMEDVAGIAAENSTMLDGMELDEGTIKAQQMVEQVSTMVKENPEAAANLVKRWLNRS